MHAVTMLIASAGLIVVALAVAVISSRFGEDKPYPDDDVAGSDETPPSEQIPRQR